MKLLSAMSTLFRKPIVPEPSLPEPSLESQLLESLPELPVEAYSATSGRTLRVFDDPRAVLAAGFSDALTALGNDSNMAHGLRWRYQQSEQSQPEPSQVVPATHPAKRRGRRPGSRLPRPIEAYDPISGKVIHRFDHVAAAAQAGFTPTTIYQVMRGKFQTHMGLCWRRAALRSTTEIVPAQRATRPVESFNLGTGEVIRRFPSVRGAEREGFKSIRDVLAGKNHSCAGMGWRYSECPMPDQSRAGWSREARPIEAVDCLTGAVAQFNTLEEAGRAGFHKGTISDVLSGRRQQYAGRKWRYCDGTSESSVPRRSLEPRAIEAIDPETGRVTWFPSIKAAVKEGFTAKAIRMVLDEKARKHGGMFWRYWRKPESQVPDSPEVAIPLLTEAHRRSELARIEQAVYLDVASKQWGVRLQGRTLFRPTRPEAVSLWYEQNAQPLENAIVPAPTPAPTLQERLDADLLDKLVNLASRKWRGTGAALAAALNLEVIGNSGIQKVVTQVRSLKPALEARGIFLSFTRSNGRKFITIDKARALSNQVPFAGRIWHDSSSTVSLVSRKEEVCV